MDQRLAALAVACTIGLAGPTAAARCAQAVDVKVDQTMEQAAEGPTQQRLSRVIVRVSTTTDRDTVEMAGEQELIEHNKAKLAELMRDNGAVISESLPGSLMLFEVTEQGMRYLLDSPLVEAVQEDRPELPQ